ncbi:hypothetical protein [Paenibacillus campi]|uniref:hypothetical protein n=1 Tax=Paenibacillus campi TaxID=3106031 RepID=UPI002AFF0BEB|nr:hypothetical protein [Paenibacillus sp. SGZ-1009]
MYGDRVEKENLKISDKDRSIGESWDNDMDGTHIFIMAPIAIVGLALLIASLADAQQKRKDDRQPVIEQISKIVDKRPMQTSETTSKFYVTIELEN